MAHTGAIINKFILSQTLQLNSQTMLENFNTSNLTLSLKKQSQFAEYTKNTNSQREAQHANWHAGYRYTVWTVSKPHFLILNMINH